MPQQLQQALQFVQAHWIISIPAIWLILSGIVNLLFWFKSPEAWLAYAEKNPRMAEVLRVIRALGFDPAKALVAIKNFIDAKAKETNPQAAVVVDGEEPAEGEEKPAEAKEKAEEKPAEDKKP